MLLMTAIGDGYGYGYGLIRDLRERSGGTVDLAEGTVYPALHRLWRAGYLSRDQQRVDGRERLTYRVTSTGYELLAKRRGEWNEVQTAVTAILATASTTTS